MKNSMISPINISMPILTPRLILKPITPEDAAIVLDYKKENWPEFLKWMIWVHSPSIEERSIDDEKKFCQGFHERFLQRKDIPVLAFERASQNLVGAGGLHNCNWEIPMFTLGFSVRTSETGKGYATEIGSALTKYAFNALSAKKVATMHAEGNIGSQRAIEKIGFEKEGVLRQQHVLINRLVDEHCYGLLNSKRLPDIDVRWGLPEVM